MQINILLIILFFLAIQLTTIGNEVLHKSFVSLVSDYTKTIQINKSFVFHDKGLQFLRFFQIIFRFFYNFIKKTSRGQNRTHLQSFCVFFRYHTFVSLAILNRTKVFILFS